MEQDVQGWRRWIPVLFGMGLTSLIFWFVQPAIMSPRGATGPSILLAERPFMAIGAMIIALVLAGGVAIAVGKLVNAVTGLFVLGWGLCILSMRSATMREVAFTEGAPLWLLVLEALLLASAAFLVAWLMFQFARTPGDIEPDPDDPNSHDLFSIASLKCAAAGLLVLPAVWFIVQTEMKGQVVAAVITGSMLAGLAGRLIAPHGMPIALFASPCFFGALGLLYGIMSTTGPVDDAIVAGAASPFLFVSPLDLFAGSLAGVALGVGWAKSFLHHEAVAA